VIDATQSAFFVSTEEQARTSVWAIVVDEADITVGVSERNELLAKDLGTLRRAVRLRQFLR
jgi:hypothetical protein